MPGACLMHLLKELKRISTIKDHMILHTTITAIVILLDALQLKSSISHYSF